MRGSGSSSERITGPRRSGPSRSTTSRSTADLPTIPERRGIRDQALGRLAYTVEEAALVVGVGRDLLYDEIRTGRLRSKKAGSRRIVARHHLVEWLDSDFADAALRAG